MRVQDENDRLTYTNDRVPLRLTCSLVGSRNNPDSVTIGVTENVSRRKVLIRWTAEANTVQRPNCGDPIAIAVKLPLGPRYLRCSGRVVCVSTTHDGYVLVAVEVHRMSFSSETETVIPENTMAKCAAN